MKTFHVSPITQGSSWKIHGWKVEKRTWLGTLSVLSKFTERQDAINFVKSLGDKNRPSTIKVFDNKKNIVSDWSYNERPRIHTK